MSATITYDEDLTENIIPIFMIQFKFIHTNLFNNKSYVDNLTTK